MSLAGKILTVAILVMSLFFLGFTVVNYTAQRNWKALVQGVDGLPGVQQQLSETRQQVQEHEQLLADTSNRIVYETAARRAALVALEEGSRRLQQQLEQERDNYDQIQRELDRNVRTLQAAQQDIKRLKDQADQLRGEGDAILVERNRQLGIVIDLRDQINQDEGPLRRLTERNKQLRGN